MKDFKIDIYRKNEKNKYEKINELKKDGKYVISDLLNYNERKIDGEKIRIIKHYNYSDKMDIDIHFNNGYKYIYHDIPCNCGATVNGFEILK